ncbi:hypothetical protein V6N13_033937 [Hibiscus sabdariffa]|uniref:RING-type domain-containing protein n=1 Tax=Hibiscus sabdariffa TaxID=183260 RepID=A0ABR2F929_9ROSI
MLMNVLSNYASSRMGDNCSQSEGQQRSAPWPSSSSFVTSKYGVVTSDQLQKARYWNISTLVYNVRIILGYIQLIYTEFTGEVIPFAGLNGPATTSNNLSRSSLKRKAAQPPVVVPQVQIKRTAKPSARSSAVDKAQTVTNPMSSVPPVRVTPQPPVQATTIPPSAGRFLSPHIKWQDGEILEPSGYNCLLCKRDLSYRPEGPILPLSAPPPVAVLPCGHCFHDLCLQRMTSNDQANNPPCIPCVIGDD